MPLPKRRFSRSRRDKRRLQQHLKAPNISRCPGCGASHISHQACPSCGTYRGRHVLPVEIEQKGKGKG